VATKLQLITSAFSHDKSVPCNGSVSVTADDDL
jgi:hypothetical protein